MGALDEIARDRFNEALLRVWRELGIDGCRISLLDHLALTQDQQRRRSRLFGLWRRNGYMYAARSGGPGQGTSKPGSQVPSSGNINISARL